MGGGGDFWDGEKERQQVDMKIPPPGVPGVADHKCCGGQPASEHPELVQERQKAMPQSHTHRGAIPLSG